MTMLVGVADCRYGPRTMVVAASRTDTVASPRTSRSGGSFIWKVSGRGGRQARELGNELRSIRRLPQPGGQNRDRGERLGVGNARLMDAAGTCQQITPT